MAINKIIPGDSQEKLIQSVGPLIQVWETGAHIKCAASPAFSRAELEALRPPKGKFMTHAITMGASDFYGSNRNCWFEGEPVRTPNGFVPIQDITKGSRVLDSKGVYQKVTKLFRRNYDGVSVSLKAQGLALPVTCTQEHPLWALGKEHVCHGKMYKRANYPKNVERAGVAYAQGVFRDAAEANAEFVEAGSLRPGDWISVPISENEVAAESVFDTDAWAYGLFLADACCYKEYRDISSQGEYKGVIFTLGSGDDAGVIPSLLEQIESHGNRATVLKSYTSEKGRRIQWCNKAFAASCDYLFGAGATTKTMSPACFNMSEEWKLQMLSGWFDGDGCLIDKGAEKYRGTLTVSSASFDLLSVAQRLLASVGIPTSVSKGTNKHSHGCFGHKDFDIYSLSVGPTHSDRILRYSRRMKTHGRVVKKAVVTQRIAAGMLWFKVTSVVLSEVKAPCFNIEVTGSHSYVTTVAGHNCDDFPEAELLRKHATFVTHGANYHEHRNSDPKLACGQIKAAKYDPVTHRGEVVFWTDIDKAASQFEKARKGEEQHGSMACTVHSDLCKCCGFVSKTASERCDHIRFTPGAYLPEFKKYAHMINVDPTFKDYSWVKRPADRIAHTLNYLMKAASTKRELRGDELADMYAQGAGWLSALQKIAEFDQHQHANPAKQAAVKAVLPRAFSGEFDNELLQKMSEHAYPARVMRSMIKRAMIMPLASFNAWVTGTSLSASEADPVVKEARSKMAYVREQLMNQHTDNPEAAAVFSDAANQFEPSMNSCEDIVDQFLDKAREQFSLRYEALTKRACHNPSRLFFAPASSISPEAFGLGALYNAYLCKVASQLEDDWMISAQMASIH